MDTRNTYEVMFSVDDGRVFTVKVRADGVSFDEGVVEFWYKRRFGRKTAHIVRKENLISVIGDKFND